MVPGAVPAAALLTLGVLAPFALFVVYSFWQQDVFMLDRTFNLDQYRTVLGDGLFRRLMARTLAQGLGVAVITVPLAYAAAYAVRFKLRRGRNAVLFAIVIATLGSYLVKVVSWQVVLAPAGLVSGGLQELGLISGPVEGLSAGRFPVTIALTHWMLPLAFLPIYAAMQSIDPDAPKAARDLGARPFTVSTRVVIPACRRGIATAFVLAFVLASGDYVTPMLLSGEGGGAMVGGMIYQQFGITRDWPLASALAVVLILAIVASLTVLWIVSRCVGWVGRWRRPPRRRTPSLPVVRIAGKRIGWAGPYLTVLFVLLYLPIVVLTAFSFTDRSIVALPVTGVSMRWYGDALSSGAFSDALANSLQLAGLVVVLCLLVGVPLAFALTRARFGLRRPLGVAIFVPLMIPGIVIGFSLLSGFTELGLEPGLFSAAIGQAALLCPLTVLLVMARLQGFDREIEFAGRDLGCTARGVLRRITLPIFAPTLVAAAIIVAAQSMDEFVITLYTAGDRTTLPILMWSILQRTGLTPVVNAIATLLVVGTTLALVAGLVALRRRGGSGTAAVDDRLAR